MEVVAAFRKPDGSLTPDMTVDEINQEKYLEYGVTKQQVKSMFFKYHKQLIEAANQGINVELKKKEDQARSA